MSNERAKVAREILGHLKGLSECFIELKRVEIETGMAAGTPEMACRLGAAQFDSNAQGFDSQCNTWRKTFETMGIKL